MKVPKTFCRVCGFDCAPLLPWGEDGLSPSYCICQKCGVEFGYEDASEAGIIKYREKHGISIDLHPKNSKTKEAGVS